VQYDEVPRFDAAFFASSSAVSECVRQWGTESLKSKTVVAIGSPTARALEQHGIPVDVRSPEATADGAITVLAAFLVNRGLGG
jgi:uroporphyrinogen-III synthase